MERLPLEIRKEILDKYRELLRKQHQDRIAQVIERREEVRGLEKLLESCFCLDLPNVLKTIISKRRWGYQEICQLLRQVSHYHTIDTAAYLISQIRDDEFYFWFHIFCDEGSRSVAVFLRNKNFDPIQLRMGLFDAARGIHCRTVKILTQAMRDRSVSFDHSQFKSSLVSAFVRKRRRLIFALLNLFGVKRNIWLNYRIRTLFLIENLSILEQEVDDLIIDYYPQWNRR